jgi:hypothetical protein
MTMRATNENLRRTPNGGQNTGLRTDREKQPGRPPRHRLGGAQKDHSGAAMDGQRADR